MVLSARGGAVSLIAESTAASPLFAAMYELICRDRHQRPEGAPTDMQNMLDSLASGEGFARKGPRVGLKRWFSWLAAAA